MSAENCRSEVMGIERRRSAILLLVMHSCDYAGRAGLPCDGLSGENSPGLASIRGLAVCVWGCECGRGRFWWWAGASCWSAQLFLCVLGSGLAAVGQVVAVTGGLNPIVLRHRASQ